MRPRAVDEVGFTVRAEGGSYGTIYRILGKKPERWVQQTDFANDEAVGFLADRLAKLGVEDELVRAGAVAGSTVVIGKGQGVVFDWEPTLTSTAELITSPRGTDVRLDESRRATRAERKSDYHERMDAKAEARAELEREREAGIWGDEGDGEVGPDGGDR
jgi:GTP-binding protein